MSVTAWILLATVCFLGLGVRLLSRFLLARDQRIATTRKAMLDPALAHTPEGGQPRPWVIVNPAKHQDLAAFQARVNATAAHIGIPNIQWITTTPQDPGTGQAIEAIAKGASLVIASGGDGTVRAVGAALAGTGVRMGIIPAGTGNVLARNLSIPIDDVERAVRIACGPEHRLVDCGWLRLDAIDKLSEHPAEGMLVRDARTAAAAQGVALKEPASLPAHDEYSFIVIAGLGFDGETMASTDSELKQRIGWFAYVVAALGAIAREGTKLRLLLRHPRPADNPVGDAPSPNTASPTIAESATLEGIRIADKPDQELAWIESRTLMFANCGLLPLITLAPAARLDDGLLDVMAVSTQSGLLGWADLSWKIFAQGTGARTFNTPSSTGHIRFRQAQGASVLAQTPQVVQVDGDAIGTARAVHVRLDQGALDIAVPPAE